jgi:hypothetical protein
MALSDEYLKLLILQYYDKPKASAEIKAIAQEFEDNVDGLVSFDSSFDIDTAVGNQLDILGKILGISRTIPFVVPKNFFGFNDNSNSYGFADKFDDSIMAYPFADKFESLYSDLELNDNDYRFFLKAKVAKNTVYSSMSRDDNNSILDVVNYLFDGKAFVVDNKDMTLTLFVDDSFDYNKVTYINQLDLLPKPQGVRYEIVIVYDDAGTFGFSDNPNSLGFADKFNSSVIGGKMAYKIL